MPERCSRVYARMYGLYRVFPTSIHLGDFQNCKRMLPVLSGSWLTVLGLTVIRYKASLTLLRTLHAFLTKGRLSCST